MWSAKTRQGSKEYHAFYVSLEKYLRQNYSLNRFHDFLSPDKRWVLISFSNENGNNLGYILYKYLPIDNLGKGGIYVDKKDDENKIAGAKRSNDNKKNYNNKIDIGAENENIKSKNNDYNKNKNNDNNNNNKKPDPFTPRYSFAIKRKKYCKCQAEIEISWNKNLPATLSCEFPDYAMLSGNKLNCISGASIDVDHPQMIDNILEPVFGNPRISVIRIIKEYILTLENICNLNWPAYPDHCLCEAKSISNRMHYWCTPGSEYILPHGGNRNTCDDCNSVICANHIRHFGDKRVCWYCSWNYD